MKFSKQILFVALFATVLIASCKRVEPDPWAAAKADCAKKNNPLYDYNWNETYHRCDSVYTGTVVNDTIHLTQGAIFAEWNNNLTSANTILSQGKYVELKFKCNQLYGVLNQLNDYLLIQKGLQGTHGERFIVKWNGKGVGLANSNTEVPQHSMWKQWGEGQNKVPLTDTLHKIPVSVQEFNLFTADGVPGSIFIKVWPTIEVTTMGQLVEAPGRITQEFANGNDTVKLNVYNQYDVPDSLFSAVTAFNTAAHNPRVKTTYTNYSHAPYGSNQVLEANMHESWGNHPISTNGEKKWWVRFNQTQHFSDLNIPASMYNILYNAMPTIEINTPADFVTAMQNVRANYAPGNTQSLKISGTFDMNNDANRDAMLQVAKQILGDSVTIENGLGKFGPANDSIAGERILLKVYNDAGALKPTSVGGNKFWFDNTNPTQGLPGQVLRVNQQNSSNLGPDRIPNKINMNGSLNMGTLVAWLNAGYFDAGNKKIKITPNGYNCSYMTQTGIENMSIPVSGAEDASKPFQFTAPVKVSSYGTVSQTYPDGIDLQRLDNHIIIILNSSQQIAGTGQRIDKIEYASSVMLDVNIPVNYMTNDNPAKPMFDYNNWHMSLVNGIFYTPPANRSTARITYPDNSVFIDQAVYDFYNGNISAFQNIAGIDGNNISILPTGNGYTIALLLQQLPTSPAPSYSPSNMSNKKNTQVVPNTTAMVNKKIKQLQQKYFNQAKKNATMINPQKVGTK